MMPVRLYKLLAGPELSLVSTLLFVALYTWPLLTFQRPSSTFKFLFGVWIVHIALIALVSFASKKLVSLERPDDVNNGSPRNG